MAIFIRLLRLPARLQERRLVVGHPRRAGDGRDRRHPRPHGRRDRRRPERRPRPPEALVLLDRGRRRAAPRAHRLAPAHRGTGLARRRARSAQPRLRASARARARLLRRAADRPAHVARDGRPAGRALLPRLRPRAHLAGRADARLRLGRGDRHRPALALISLAPVPLRHLDRPALRPPGAAGAAGGPAAHRRADGRRRGERRRRARRQGVRRRGAPREALPHERLARLRAVDDLHPAARVLQPVHRLPATARPRGAAAHRRADGHRQAA